MDMLGTPLILDKKRQSRLMSNPTEITSRNPDSDNVISQSEPYIDFLNHGSEV